MKAKMSVFKNMQEDTHTWDAFQNNCRLEFCELSNGGPADFDFSQPAVSRISKLILFQIIAAICVIMNLLNKLK